MRVIEGRVFRGLKRAGPRDGIPGSGKAGGLQGWQLKGGHSQQCSFCNRVR